MNDDVAKLPAIGLLTDALAAGPASPQWQAALRAIRELAPDTAEEYRAILVARERLEQGRDFRSVWAGPTFTRELNDALDAVVAKRSAGPSWSRLVLIASLLALAVSGGVTIWLLHSARTVAPDPTTTTLQFAYLQRPILTLPLNRTPLPDVATVSGNWPLKSTPAATGGSFGFMLNRRFEPSERFAVELVARAPRDGDDVVQLAVASADGASELSLVLRGRQLSVVKSDGTIEIVARTLRSSGGRSVLRMAIDERDVCVQPDGAAAWVAPHGLPLSTRTVSVRVAGAPPATRPSDETATVILESLRVLGP